MIGETFDPKVQGRGLEMARYRTYRLDNVGQKIDRRIAHAANCKVGPEHCGYQNSGRKYQADISINSPISGCAGV